MSRFDFEYKAPIDIIYDDPMEHLTQEIVRKTDEVIYKTVLNTGVNVDKDELIKALQYDRQQYEQGYKDGYYAGKEDSRIHGQWIIARELDDIMWGNMIGGMSDYKWECSICGCPSTSNNHCYCPQCGAYMEVFKVD